MGGPGGQTGVRRENRSEFYRGKTVRIIVGFSAGGGYDQYSRVIARHLAKYIPGSPAVIVDNMPGAGSIIAANHVYNAAPKDGTVVGNISGPIVLEQLFRGAVGPVRYGKVSLSSGPRQRKLHDDCHQANWNHQIR